MSQRKLAIFCYDNKISTPSFYTINGLGGLRSSSDSVRPHEIIGVLRTTFVQVKHVFGASNDPIPHAAPWRIFDFFLVALNILNCFVMRCVAILALSGNPDRWIFAISQVDTSKTPA